MPVRLTLAVISGALLALALSARQGGVPKEEGSEAPQRLIASLDGGDLFRAYCASCHGKDGKGGGPAAKALKAKVPDLTRIRQRMGGRFPAARVEKIIAGEEIVTAAHGSREMPVWGPVFGQIAWDQDLGKVRLRNLTKYIESIQQD